MENVTNYTRKKGLKVFTLKLQSINQNLLYCYHINGEKMVVISNKREIWTHGKLPFKRRRNNLTQKSNGQHYYVRCHYYISIFYNILQTKSSIFPLVVTPETNYTPLWFGISFFITATTSLSTSITTSILISLHFILQSIF